MDAQHQNARAYRTRVCGQEQGFRGPPAKSCAVLNLSHRAKTASGRAGRLVGWWAGRRRAGGSVGLRADRLHGGPRLRVPTSIASSLVKSEHTFAVRHERRAWPGRSRVSSPAPEFAILIRKRAGCSVAEVPQKKKELDSVQTKMENPCVNSGSQVVNGIDN
jgi:hypothetical protein